MKYQTDQLKLSPAHHRPSSRLAVAANTVLYLIKHVFFLVADLAPLFSLQLRLAHFLVLFAYITT